MLSGLLGTKDTAVKKDKKSCLHRPYIPAGMFHASFLLEAVSIT